MPTTTEPVPARTAIPLAAAAFPGRCRGVGLAGVIRGDATDIRVVWLETSSGPRTLVWPPDYVAAFDPTLAVLDERGQVKYLEGQAISGVCLKGTAQDPGAIVLIDE